MSGAGFFAATTSPAAITSNTASAGRPNTARLSASTLGRLVVVATASRKPAARARAISAATPGRRAMAPSAISAT